MAAGGAGGGRASRAGGARPHRRLSRGPGGDPIDRIAVVLVHYHAAELAARALAALRADLAAAGVEAEWILVDNGSDGDERALLASLPVERLDPGENLGFAGGVNLGVAASTAEAMVVMNPDVEVLPGCVPALLAELGRGAAVAGPSFFWDAGRRLRLPPAELRSRREEILATLALRGGGWARRARRRWRRHARRHWLATRPLASYCLSGALLALRRSAWEEVGPFDAGYRLYFEESDWLRRAAARNLPAVYVPAAEAIHLYDQSAGREPRAAAWFAESAARFRRRHYGAWFPPLLARLAPRPPAGAPPAVPRRREEPRPLDLAALGRPFPLWVEVSSREVGFPAAAERIAAPPAAPWSLPADVAARLPPGEMTVWVSDEAGRELLRVALPVAGGGPAGPPLE